MTLKSMTGFARRGGETTTFRWNMEIKSVNNKGLEVRVKLPSFLDGFDIEVKKLAGQVLTRGSVFINIQIDQSGDSEDFVVNEERLKTLIAFAAKYGHQNGVKAARIDGLMNIKGVVEASSAEPDEKEIGELKKTLKRELEILLSDIVTARAEEGARMHAFLNAQLNEMKSLVSQATALVGDRSQAMQDRFLQQLKKLENTDKPIAEDRLAQEIALLIVKADIQEELDRLDSHFGEADALLNDDKPVGRRLDFLCQEFNREANTLCSKANDTRLTKIGVDLKVLIDQFREQVQNIE